MWKKDKMNKKCGFTNCKKVFLRLFNLKLFKFKNIRGKKLYLNWLYMELFKVSYSITEVKQRLTWGFIHMGVVVLDGLHLPAFNLENTSINNNYLTKFRSFI